MDIYSQYHSIPIYCSTDKIARFDNLNINIVGPRRSVLPEPLAFALDIDYHTYIFFTPFS